jgi:NADH:ubiquinone oxidoreductase subunit C
MMTTDYQKELQALPGATELIRQRDGWWMSAPALDVCAAARTMLAWEGRLSTMTGYALPGNETEVIYHYYLDHQTYNLKVCTQNNSLPSISPVLPAADWIEREIQDLYGVEFKNHPHPDRLIRPVNMEPGMFREPGGAAGKNRS